MGCLMNDVFFFLAARKAWGIEFPGRESKSKFRILIAAVQPNREKCDGRRNFSIIRFYLLLFYWEWGRGEC